MGFLIVGHIHEDINRSFGYLLKKLKEQNNYVMADLMKTFMFSQNHPFIPQLFQEISDFKSWVNGYLNNGPNILINHMHLFWFFVAKVRWPIFNTKYLLLMLCGALKMAQPYDYKSRMTLDDQNCGQRFQILFHFVQYGEMMN
jgi:hypothetical protein